VARKQTRGTQISRIAAAAAIAAALTLAAPLWAQQKASKPAQPKTAQQKASPAKPSQKTAGTAVAAVEREIRQTQGALDSIRAELEKGRARFRELQNEEGTYLSRLEQIEKNISASGRYMDMLQKQIDTTEKTLGLLNDSLVIAEAGLYGARETMKRRLRSAYMTGEINRLQVLFTAKSPTEFVHRVRFFQDLNRYDRQLAASIKGSIVKVNEKKNAHEENRIKLIKLLADKKTEQTALVEEEAQRRVVLKDVRTQKEASAAMVAELEEAHRGLNALITMLEERRKRAKEEDERQALINFEKRKGKLGWPARGEVTAKFGRVVHPVYKTVTDNDGIDIAVKKGTPVRNVAPGTALIGSILYKDGPSLRGLGRYVIVDHGGGYYTIYAHLDEITTGHEQKIGTGDEIGKSGSRYSEPKLSFKIKKMIESLNPEEWLEKY